jgi:pyrrolidone-carboxylate peptidase
MKRALLLLTFAVTGCAIERDMAEDDDLGVEEDSVVVDTRDPIARAQYDANAKFATNYRARCTKTTSGRPRVLVTGFGRFLDNETNATGQLVSAMVSATYPRTARPTGVDDPAPQTAVTQKTVTMKGIAVDVCAMVVPVFWDLAAVLAIKEIESFAPDLVVMNGIAGSTQPLWFELGGVNRAMTLEDGSDVLHPQAPAGQSFAKLVPSALVRDEKRSNLLSWRAVKDATIRSIDAHRNDLESGRTFGEIVFGAQLAGYPRSGNTYLCNNLAYVVGYAMGYPGRTLTLMQASHPIAGRINRVRVAITRDLRSIPRVFIHWPAALQGAHLLSAADVLKGAIAGQILATRAGDRSTPGENGAAEIQPEGGTF